MLTLRRRLGRLLARPSAFAQMRRAYQARLRHWRPLLTQRGQGRQVGVLITPWLMTAVPFFSLECALMLARAGCRVTLLWDATDLVGNAARPEEIAEIEQLLAGVRELVEVIAVHRLDPVAGEDDAERSRALLFEFAVIGRRGENNLEEFYRAHPDGLARIAAHLRTVERLLATRGFDWLLIPGGVYGVAPVYGSMAKKIDFTTYDSGAAVLIIGHGGVAGHHPDIAPAVANAEEWLAAHPSAAERPYALAREEMQARMGGQGSYFDFQSVPMREGAPTRRVDALVVLNIRWDAAALLRQKVFPTTEAWITALVRWANEQADLHLWIRQHPAERFEHMRSSDDVGALVARESRAPDRIHFVAADDPINTYELLQPAKVLLPHSSSLGIEAAMLGIPVVLANHTYYEDLPSSWQAESPEEYLALAGRAVRGELTISDAARRKAALTYYLSQHSEIMHTDFTAEPKEFASWVQEKPADLWQRPELRDLREALLQRTPLASVRFRREAESWLA